MSENRKQGNAQIPREAIQGAAGEKANYELGVAAVQEDERGNVVITNIIKCKQPIDAMKAQVPDFSNVKALAGGLKETLQKGSKEPSQQSSKEKSERE